MFVFGVIKFWLNGSFIFNSSYIEFGFCWGVWISIGGFSGWGGISCGVLFTLLLLNNLLYIYLI